MSARARVILGLLVLLLASAASPTARAQAVRELEPQELERLELELGKATLLRSPQRVTRASIADPEVAGVTLVTPRQILLTARGRTGSTNLILWHGDTLSQAWDVVVTLPSDLADRIETRLAEIVPEARVRVAAGSQGLVLHGEVDGTQTLERVLAVAESYHGKVRNLVQVRGPQQVQLQVQIAEVSRSAIRRMGLGFLVSRELQVGVLPPGGAGSGVLSGSGTRESGAADAFQGALDSTAALGSPFSSAFQIALRALDDDFFGILSLLKSQAAARILASPTLVALSGQEASFLVGGEFPVPVDTGDDAVAIQFKEFGTLLRFTPYVRTGDVIHLRVEPEVSSTDFGVSAVSAGVSVPGLSTRRSATTLELRSGQSFVMAGLLQEEESTVRDAVPFLGDIPFLGTLFTSKEIQRQETELVVAVTASLVEPLPDGESPRLPTDDAPKPPSDFDFFLRNRTGAVGPHPGSPRFTGDVGFVR